FEFPRSQQNVPRPSEIANFKATQRLDTSSTQQPLQSQHHDDATIDADQDVSMVGQNDVVSHQSDTDSATANVGAKAPKR
uniref:Uncharacterized protein n=1 Tax=Panagrolaimus sp. PS1159 TaxID=55785 RepID=A0AC35FD20_9BILA